MQLTGKPCGICSENILWAGDATACVRCNTAVHRECLQKKNGYCPKCEQPIEAPAEAAAPDPDTLKQIELREARDCLLRGFAQCLLATVISIAIIYFQLFTGSYMIWVVVPVGIYLAGCNNLAMGIHLRSANKDK